jgi:hypothetical protein
MAAPNKVTPDRAFLLLSPHYDHHSRKRLEDALSGAISLILLGQLRFQSKSQRGCGLARLNLRLWFWVNARKNKTINWDF